MSDKAAVLQEQLETLKAQLFEQDFDSITPEGVQDMLRAFVEDDLGLYAGEGGLLNIIMAPGAYVFWEGLQALRAQQAIAFPDADSGLYLASEAAQYGITPKAGVKATVMVTFTGSAGTVVPIGTLCVTSGRLSFATDAALTLGDTGTGTVSATAVEVGAEYNIPANTIITTQEAISGVTAVTNEEKATGGTDAESDAALFKRLDDYRKKPATSGNDQQYKQWAMEVNGIGAASVIRLWDGPGTVKVIVANMELRPVSTDVCQTIKNYIDSKRPVTADVTVVSAAGVGIAIAATIESDGTVSKSDTLAAFNRVCSEYIGSLAFQTGAEVVYNRILSLLMGLDGVKDCTALTINGATVNVPLTANQVPLLGDVTLEVTGDGA